MKKLSLKSIKISTALMLGKLVGRLEASPVCYHPPMVETDIVYLPAPVVKTEPLVGVAGQSKQFPQGWSAMTTESWFKEFTDLLKASGIQELRPEYMTMFLEKNHDLIIRTYIRDLRAMHHLTTRYNSLRATMAPSELNKHEQASKAAPIPMSINPSHRLPC